MQYRRFMQATSLVLALAASPAVGHEFWIEPLDFSIEAGEAIQAQNRTGQMLKGNIDPYITSMFKTFTLSDQDKTRPVTGRLGDRPALRMKPERGGLHIAGYESSPSTLRYRKTGKFEKFVSKEGMKWVLGAHKGRGLPETGFREAYTRFAKSLIAVGDGDGADRTIGLRLELVALTNPYLDGGPVAVQLLKEGIPIADIQVAVFRRDRAGVVTRITMRTDEEGKVIIPRKRADVTLLSAVHMVEPTQELSEQRGVVWHSLWASLTYGAPIN